jgi:hypothetical protein
MGTATARFRGSQIIEVMATSAARVVAIAVLKKQVRMLKLHWWRWWGMC